MTGEFEFTLRSPLTQDDWNKISDAELENTMSITFQTPQGRQVKYIKCDVLDKIRAEIEAYQSDAFYHDNVMMNKKMVLDIIDKYKSEVSE